MNVAKEYDSLVGQFMDFVMKANAKGIIVGLSGGIDSAVVATLAKNALGPHNVMSVYLPCCRRVNMDYSIEEKFDYNDARNLAKALEIDFRVLDLSATFATLCMGVNKCLSTAGENSFDAFGHISQLAQGNMAARLRMVSLYALKEDLNMLCAGTGNLSEIMLGYLTKYGDGGIDFEPLGAYYKTEVYEIASYLDIFSMSPNIMVKSPSARLWDGQTDEEDLGWSYDEIDRELESILRCGELCPPNYNEKLRNKLSKMIAKSEHKRNIPPVFKRLV